MIEKTEYEMKGCASCVVYGSAIVVGMFVTMLIAFFLIDWIASWNG